MLSRRPPPELSQFAETMWLVDAPVSPGLESKVPTGHSQLLVNLADDKPSWFDDVDSARAGRRNTVGGVGVCGPQLSPVVIDRAEQRWCAGVTLRPGATLALLGIPAEALADPVVGLDGCGVAMDCVCGSGCWPHLRRPGCSTCSRPSCTHTWRRM